MVWFWCFRPRRSRNEISNVDDNCGDQSASHKSFCSSGGSKNMDNDDNRDNERIRSFSFVGLAAACHNFSNDNLIGEGGFGKVYKGHLVDGQTVAIKLLDLNGVQGNQEFVTEVLMLSVLEHPNLVNLFGYCITGSQRALVYEYMPKGSLESHLFCERPLEWRTRIRIALGMARGLEYLHCKVDPPVIHRDLKPTNILLDEDFNPKLSDFGLAKLGPVGGKSHVTTRVMGTQGYCAPEYAETGKLTTKSDVFSFGVVLLELISGRRSYEPEKRRLERYLVAWSRTVLWDPRKIVDPRLRGCFLDQSLKQAIAITRACLQEKADIRPLISDVRVALEYLAS